MEENTEKLVVAKYYDSVLNAELDMEVLKNSNIESTVTDDMMVGIFPLFDEKERGISLLVFEKDLDVALQILDDYHCSTPVNE
ncbi:MAG TPA: hypothetical protein PKH58_04965 [Paludibacteraceae bacterium]|nr:hypothetical protein [Paludibacteraceae bacterium]HPT42560.1 hypothetical protein [Paludibacteraceae bacterium]